MKQTILLPAPRQIDWGWRYLAFQVAFLSYLLVHLLYLLGLQISSAQINFLYFCLNFAAALVIFHRFLLSSFQDALRRFWRIPLWAAIGFLAYFLLSRLVSILILLLEPGFANINDQSIQSFSREQYLLTAIGTVVLVPTAEELFHRGAIFGGLYRKNRLAAYGVSVLIFALVHITGYIGRYPPHLLLLCLLQYIPAGICLAVSYACSGSILTPIVIHTVINAIGILATR